MSVALYFAIALVIVLFGAWFVYQSIQHKDERKPGAPPEAPKQTTHFY